MKGFLNGLGTMLGVAMIGVLSAVGGAIWVGTVAATEKEHHERTVRFLNDAIENLKKDKEKLEEENKILKEI